MDAMPGSMKLFNNIRPRDINIEKPISDKKQTLTYYAFNEPALNGFSKELSEKRESADNDYHIIFTKDIETFTLAEVLDQKSYQYNPRYQDNFEKYKPKVILIEILESSLSKIENHEITKYLKENNYSIYAKAVGTVFFVMNE